MKKNHLILLAILSVISLSAFAFINIKSTSDTQSNIDFFYGVDSRYATTLTKDKVINARWFDELFPERATKGIETWHSTEVVVLEGENKIKSKGIGNRFSPDQFELLQSIDYSTNFYITANCEKRRDPLTLEKDSIVYWMTIIPENEARYKDGHNALIDYLKKNSQDDISIVKQGSIQPGRIDFLISTEGKIENISLDSSTGYPTIDDAMINLVNKIPGQWIPASNSNGEAVPQKLVFFFGNMGC
ncbi:MAG: hypothetical protein HKN67_12800 [Saprospiraceae bacterium]|nr:energy transducer TonB [Bacteroidia bacterium]NNF22816.1 hypothetical protein [Saprospiraceae bacterium]